jgi:Flp pilus assembly protein TadG
MMNRLMQKARELLRNRRGMVAVWFGICLVPMMIAVGAGLDYARTSVTKSQMSDALDAAALAVGSTPGLTQADAQALAQKYFAANYTGDTSNGTPQVSIASGGYNAAGSVTVTATYNLPTQLMKIANINTMAISVSSTVVWGQTKLWVSLVLDNSGSMANGDSTGSKMTALHNASHQLLTILQNAATNDGDVQVSIVPFTRNVNVGAAANVSASWIDWRDWEAPPPSVSLSTSVGPGSSCPFTTSSNRQMSPYGFYCVASATNGASTVSTVPSSGLICPGIDSGTYNGAHQARYYNGCWDSVIAQTQTATKTTNTPITVKQACSQVGSGTITCTTSSTTNGTASSSTATTVSAGYSGDSTSSSTSTATSSTTDGTKSCSTSKGVTTCTWTRTILQTKTDIAVTNSAYGGYTHTWRVNSHSTWVGCLMDRDKTYNYDIQNVAPTTTATGFPAENPASCPAATVSTLGYNWTALGSKIDAMVASGSTNQAIGMAHGWQTMSNSDPYNPGAVPTNTTRYIIILSDGLNTQDRWWGDGSTENTTEDGYIDDRMNQTCTAAKADGVVVYSIYVNIGGTDGNSAPLQNCASDSTKFFALTTTSAVVTTFNQIAQQITNVRVSR